MTLTLATADPRAVEFETDAIVASRETAADDVVVLTLRAADGEALPHWEPGAHVDLLTPVGPRQYSLCGSPTDETWRIAVLHEPDGRGGSAWVHTLGEGDTATVRGPRNHSRSSTRRATSSSQAASGSPRS